MNHPQIAAFARLAKENTLPVRALEGQKTLISRTMHSLAYDSIHDEIVVNSPLAQAVLIFRGGANGEEAPIRVIQGPHTEIQGTDYDGNDQMAFDEIHGEIYLPVAGNKILVFSREANGDAPPLRVLGGPDTQIRGTARGHARVGVDPVHNLLLVPVNEYSNTSQALNESKILIFDRTATGNTKPRAIMRGARIGTIYAPKKRLIDHRKGYLEIWNIPDTGEVAQPIMRISAPLEPRDSGGVMTLDPGHKEVIIATAAGNTIKTFYVPEVFD